MVTQRSRWPVHRQLRYEGPFRGPLLLATAAGADRTGLPQAWLHMHVPMVGSQH